MAKIKNGLRRKAAIAVAKALVRHNQKVGVVSINQVQKTEKDEFRHYVMQFVYNGDVYRHDAYCLECYDDAGRQIMCRETDYFENMRTHQKYNSDVRSTYHFWQLLNHVEKYSNKDEIKKLEKAGEDIHYDAYCQYQKQYHNW